MSKKQIPVTINTIISLTDNPEIYVQMLTEGQLRTKVDKSVCKTLYQLAGEFLMEQKVYGSAYFAIDPNLSAIENQKEIQARLRDLQHILTNRAVAIFYLNMQNNYNFGAFSDIEKNLYDISRRDYWFILQEPEWRLVLSTIKSPETSQAIKNSMKKILEAFSLHLYAYLVNKDSMYREHTSIGRGKQMIDDMSQMGYEAVLKYLENFDISKPGNPYMNTHVVKNEINSKLNDYGCENRNDRTRRANWNAPGRIDFKSELLRPCSLDEYMQRECTTDEPSAINDAVLVDESSGDGYREREVLEDFKKIYLSLDLPIEKKVLYRSFFESENWSQTELARDLHISPTRLKKIKAKIEKKAYEFGVKWYM